MTSLAVQMLLLAGALMTAIVASHGLSLWLVATVTGGPVQRDHLGHILLGAPVHALSVYVLVVVGVATTEQAARRVLPWLGCPATPMPFTRLFGVRRASTAVIFAGSVLISWTVKALLPPSIWLIATIVGALALTTVVAVLQLVVGVRQHRRTR